MSQLLTSVLAHLNCGPAVIVGHSMGGYVAAEFALRSREQIIAIALLATNVFGDEPTQRLMRLRRAAEVERGMLEHFLREQLEMITPVLGSDLVIEEVIRANVRPHLAPLLREYSNRMDLSSELAGLRAPLGLLVGDQDTNLLLPMAELAARVPSARCEILRDAGHMLPVEAPTGVAEWLKAFMREFALLARLSGRAAGGSTGPSVSFLARRAGFPFGRAVQPPNPRESQG